MIYRTTTLLFSLLGSFLILITLVSTAWATVPSWAIVPEESTLTFTGTQNNAPVQGTFKLFSGEINADPEQLAASHVKITVDLSSISTSFKDISDTLKTSEWFDVAGFPEAIFESSQFTKIDGNKLQAKGNLSLKGKSLPVILVFSYEKISDNKVKVTGGTDLKRNDFGVGTGEWASTDEIKNEVQVNFIITATKK